MQKGAGDTSLGGPHGSFPATTMGLFSRLWDPSAADRQSALETLCRRYWKPVYRYLRIARAKGNDDAKDLAQAFFLWLLEEEALKPYDPGLGSFRGFLKLLLNRFTSNEDKAVRRLKRGGGVKVLPLDDEASTLRETVEDARAETPDQAFDREWLRTMAQHAVDRVRERFRSTGRELHIRAYEEAGLGRDDGSYAGIAARLGLKEGEVRRYLFVVREAIRDELRAELSQTTFDPKALEEEWRALFGA